MPFEQQFIKMQHVNALCVVKVYRCALVLILSSDTLSLLKSNTSLMRFVLLQIKALF